MKILVFTWWLLLAGLSAGSAYAQELKLVLPVGSNCTSGVFSPNGRLEANCSASGSIKIWDAWTGTLLQELTQQARPGLLNSSSIQVAFSTDGSLLATNFSYWEPGVRFSYQVVVWRVATGKILFELPTQLDELTFKFSPNGNQLLTQSAYTNVSKPTLWDVSTGKQLVQLPAAENTVNFSPDGNRLVSESANAGKVWESRTGKLLLTLPAHQNTISTICFSPNSRQLLTASTDGTAKIWDATTGSVLTLLEHAPFGGMAEQAVFSTDGQRVLAATDNHLLCQWSVATGQLLAAPAPTPGPSGGVEFSPDRRWAIGRNAKRELTVWNTATGLILYSLHPPNGWEQFDWWFSQEGRRLAVNCRNVITSGISVLTSIQLLDTQTGQVQTELRGHTRPMRERVLSPDGQTVALLDAAGQLTLWNMVAGTRQSLPQTHHAPVEAIGFSANGRYLTGILGGMSFGFTTWDLASARLLTSVVATGDKPPIGGRGKFNADNTRVLLVNSIAYNDEASRPPDTVRLWNVRTGRLLSSTNCPATAEGASFSFSPDGRYALIGSNDQAGTVQLLDATSGAVLATVRHPRRLRPDGSYGPLNASFSPDGLQVLTSNGNEVKVWHTTTGRPLKVAVKEPQPLWPTTTDLRNYGQEFSPDGRKLLSFSTHADLPPQPPRIWDAATGTEVALAGMTSPLLMAKFNSTGTTVLTTSGDSILRVWDAATGLMLRQLAGCTTSHGSYLLVDPQLRYALSWPSNYSEQALRCQWFDHPGNPYTLLLLDESDHLVYDRHYRYDGTSAARKLLNLACGGESIGLDQLKDQLWLPGLAQRLARDETINAPTIEQLDLCGLTPEVEPLAQPTPAENSPGRVDYRYRIHPRRGGLGDVALSVNGIEVWRFKPDKLRKSGSDYELRVPAAELATYFVAGQANPVTVAAYTSQNAIASRGAVLVAESADQATPPPNLFAVVVGVSDYKGEALDLKYAAKDAHDLGRALGASARQLLNHDGQEHVFVHELSTGPDREALPEKQAIRTALARISERAVAGDIVLLFFAGHGVTAGPDKRFYFLTADASPASATDAGAAARVGISTQELGEWLRPDLLKAQKRVLIFDACQSGQAINDFVKLGNDTAPYLAARSDDAGQRIKAVERLNNQSGLFVLAAASSTQSAYELGRYSQGLLTYALLRAIKEQPDILEAGKYLSVARWFAAADQGVQELASASGQRQQPQLVSTTNFNIGEVDETVRHSIALPLEKPVFAASNFQNSDPAIVDDDLGLSHLLDGQLQQLSARGDKAPLVYAGAAGLPGAYSLLGRYAVQAGTVRVQVRLRLGQRVVAQYEASGPASDMEKLAVDVATRACERVQELK